MSSISDFSPKKREQFSQPGSLFSPSATPSFLAPFFQCGEDTPFGDFLDDALILQTLENRKCRLCHQRNNAAKRITPFTLRF